MDEQDLEPEDGMAQEDLGEPILELRELEVPVSAGFLSRLVSSLRRRSLVNQLATMAWTGAGETVLEFLKMIFSLFNPGKAMKEDSTDG